MTPLAQPRNVQMLGGVIAVSMVTIHTANDSALLAMVRLRQVATDDGPIHRIASFLLLFVVRLTVVRVSLSPPSCGVAGGLMRGRGLSPPLICGTHTDPTPAREAVRFTT